jgi:hypothetical protein
MPQFDIVCLANSRKLRGHCMAGLRVDGAGWLRPVSDQEGGVLWPTHYTLTNGREAKTLDVIRVSLAAPRPAIHQPENWLLDGRRWSLSPCPWAKTASVLCSALVRGPELLTGRNERVPFAHFQKGPAPASLALVAPEDVYLYPHQVPSGKPKARGRISLGAGENLTLYDLPITEPYWQDVTLKQGPRTLRQSEGKFLLTISLSEPFEGDCYKLIAAIIPLPRYLAMEI